MIELRDKVIAHRDLDGPVTDWGFISQLQLNSRPEGLEVVTISPSMSEEMAAKTIPLLNCLIAEMDRRTATFVKKHLHTPPNHAKFTVSLDRSPTEWLIPMNAIDQQRHRTGGQSNC